MPWDDTQEITQMTINAIDCLGGEVTASGRKTLINGATKTGMFTRRRVDAVRAWRQKRDRAATRELANTPSTFAEVRQPTSDYLALPTVSSIRRRYIPVAMLSSDVIASNQVYVFPNATLYDFGIVSSEMHMAWVRSVGGRLKSDYRYSAGIVYNNFPWPIDATGKDKAAIAAAAQEVLRVRGQFSDSSLADLYDPLSMPQALLKAHHKLDKAVDKAYISSGGKRSWPTEAQRVAFLFALHQKIASMLPPKKVSRKVGLI
ncbi:type IIL restriction-modification enzyme MmeI [Marinobacter sp. LN3S78]|uniref:type IIL restriction-modification enzyme MmeI n=1 Tax=Marinobacter sp. LN3S78 TaxID=3382300 RepID=UPI00387AFDCC